MFYAANLNTMSNFSCVKIMLNGILCLFTIQQGITANSSCHTPQLKPSDPAVITIFDSQYLFQDPIWSVVCAAVETFPQGLITVEYRPGALASGTGNNMKCGSGNCKIDRYQSCRSRSKNYNNCYADTVFHLAVIYECYCKQDSNKQLLENAALRAKWNVPENAVPTLVVNQTYDSCIKFGTTQELINYLCVVYQKKVGPCT